MFSKVNRLESLLNKLSESLQQTDKKSLTANQALKAENIHLAEGATLNIQMNNMIFSVEIVKECLEILEGIKRFLPIAKHHDLKSALTNYENTLTVKALEESDFKHNEAAKKLGITDRQMRYWITKNPEYKKFIRPSSEDIIDV